MGLASAPIVRRRPHLSERSSPALSEGAIGEGGWQVSVQKTSPRGEGHHPAVTPLVRPHPRTPIHVKHRGVVTASRGYPDRVVAPTRT